MPLILMTEHIIILLGYFAAWITQSGLSYSLWRRRANLVIFAIGIDDMVV